MKFSTAVIDEHAFVALITAALEVFDKETYGVLLGSEYKRKILIKNAVAYQKATRKASEVSVWPAHEHKVRTLLHSVARYKVLGDFHSHPYGPAALSKHDKKDMIEDGERITLLISVEPVEEKIPWYCDKKDKTLIGTVHDEYLFTIKVCIREWHKKIIKKMKIDCPYIKRFNKM